MHSVYSIIKTMLIRKLTIFGSHRLATIDMTNAEYLSILGIAYRVNIDQTFAIGESVWLKMVMPSDAEVEIITRNLMPNIAGASIELYKGSTTYTLGTSLTVHRLDELRGRAALTTVNVITTPSNIGTLQDTPVFIGAGQSPGTSSRPAGTLSGDQGFQIYGKSETVFIRITNTAGIAQRMVFRLVFSELVESIISGE